MRHAQRARVTMPRVLSDADDPSRQSNSLDGGASSTKPYVSAVIIFFSLFPRSQLDLRGACSGLLGKHNGLPGSPLGRCSEVVPRPAVAGRKKQLRGDAF